MSHHSEQPAEDAMQQDDDHIIPLQQQDPAQQQQPAQQNQAQQQQPQLTPRAAVLSQEAHIMKCKVSSAKQISSLLSSMIISKDTQWATCVLSNNAMKFVVEEDKCYRSTATLKKNLFQDYNYFYDQNVIRFDINLKNLIDCMNIYGTTAQDTSFTMSYPGVDNSLILTYVVVFFFTPLTPTPLA